MHTLCHICNVQVSVRRKAKPNDTVKQLKKNLEKFAETGVHPEIERLRQERNNAIPALPDLDINRPFVFLDISVGNKPLGGFGRSGVAGREGVVRRHNATRLPSAPQAPQLHLPLSLGLQ